MPQKPYLVVSDVHLGAVPPTTERAFREFLAFAAEDASGLLINGDLFDFWFEYRSVILRAHFRVLGRLAEVVEAGLPVRFVGGNHDGWAGEFLRNDVGIEIVDGPSTMDLGGRRALVAHGDGVGTGDLGYRVLRRVIRSGLAVRGFRSLHPDWGGRIARLASTTHEKAGRERPEHNVRAERIAEWARAQLHACPALDLVIAGHAHQACVQEVEPGRFYANAGDWLTSTGSYLELPADGRPPILRAWTTSR